MTKGGDVASATALTLGTDGNYFDITGTTTITSIGDLGGDGTMVTLHFDGALILTHHATDLILPGGANITTAAGDEFTFVNYATGDWRCVGYALASGAAVLPDKKGADIASAATLVLGTDGNYFDVTGTTGISAITVAVNRLFRLQFDGALTLTHHATNLDLPGEANITTAAGDSLVGFATAANQVHVLSYTKADGTAVSGGGGAWTLISDNNPSAVATLDLTGFDATKYGSYFVVYELRPVSDDVSLFIRTSSDGGSTFDSGAGEYSWGDVTMRQTVRQHTYSDAATEIEVCDSGAIDVGNQANEGISGHFFIYAPDVTEYTRIRGDYCVTNSSSSEFHFGWHAGMREYGADVDGVQLLFSSGNISAGNVQLYGLKLS